MSLMMTTRRRREIPPLPALPYAVPTSAPFNVPQHLATPTFDATGNTVHPDVIDFWMLRGVAKWGGYRFWMAHTPYYNSDSARENPAILASNDGVTWLPPAGLVRDPLYPTPATKWNSDTELLHDSVTNELVLIYRGPDFEPLIARSPNGAWWPATPTPISRPSAGEEAASPTIVQMPNGQWVMWAVGYPSRKVYRWTADVLEGPWSAPTITTGLPVATWHIDVLRIGTKLYMLIDDAREDEPSIDAIYLASSVDQGHTWVRKSTPSITLGSGGWDDDALYRGTIQPHENGTHMRVWYGGRAGYGSALSWHVGLTLIPLSEWP